jgi:long-subunit fatty acid transport protein
MSWWKLERLAAGTAIVWCCATHAQTLNPAQLKQIEDIAADIAAQHNLNAASLIDDMTVFTRATAQGRNVRIEYVLRVKKGLPPQKIREFADETKREVLPHSCAQNARNPAFDRGLSFSFVYTNTDGEKLANFTVDKQACGRK